MDWIEVVLADRDGKFHSVQETLDRPGNVLDTVYVNNNYNPSDSFPIDVLAGPDQLYVWSECGLALDTLIAFSPSEAHRPGHLLSENKINTGTSVPAAVTTRYPSPYPSLKPVPGAENAVLMKFLFPSTSYDGFAEFYMYRIPYGLWDVYIAEVRSGH